MAEADTSTGDITDMTAHEDVVSSSMVTSSMVTSSTMVTSSVHGEPVVIAVPDSVSELSMNMKDRQEVSLSVPEGLVTATSTGQLYGITDSGALQDLLCSPVVVTGGHLQIRQPEGIQIIAVTNPGDLLTQGDAANRVWQIVPGTNPEIATIVAVQESDLQEGSIKLDGTSDGSCNEVSCSMTSPDPLASILMPPPPLPPQPLPPNCPAWASRLKCCEVIGDSYRGYVESEVELDLLLTYHKQQTQSFWGTRQSPSPARLSTRLMWKSQYVPFDGIPFINSGSRAVVMECQFGPRRKGSTQKKQLEPSMSHSGLCADSFEGLSPDHNDLTSGLGDEMSLSDSPAVKRPAGQMYKRTCPARIYIKKVRKFPEYAVDPNLDKKMLKLAMDKSFQSLKGRILEISGQERFYVQLPAEKAHEFHEEAAAVVERQQQQQQQQQQSEDESSSRLHPQVKAKIREMVAGGETRIYAVRKAVRAFVLRDLFPGAHNTLPERHDLTYFPTVNDLKNQIHSALKDIEKGVLPLTASTVNLEVISSNEDGQADVSEIQQVDNTLWPPATSAGGDNPTPETVTVTLTQNPGEDGHHIISRIETHLSDGTTQISTTLTPETAQILSKLHPSMFPAGSLIQFQGSEAQNISMSEQMDSQEIPCTVEESDSGEIPMEAESSEEGDEVEGKLIHIVNEGSAAESPDQSNIVTVATPVQGEIVHMAENSSNQQL